MKRQVVKYTLLYRDLQSSHAHPWRPTDPTLFDVVKSLCYISFNILRGYSILVPINSAGVLLFTLTLAKIKASNG